MRYLVRMRHGLLELAAVRSAAVQMQVGTA